MFICMYIIKHIMANTTRKDRNPVSTVNVCTRYRADSRLAPSQWVTSLQSDAVSHWLGASPVLSIYLNTPVMEGFISGPSLWSDDLPSRSIVSCRWFVVDTCFYRTVWTVPCVNSTIWLDKQMQNMKRYSETNIFEVKANFMIRSHKSQHRSLV